MKFQSEKYSYANYCKKNLLILLVFLCAFFLRAENLDLKGTWQFQTDSADQGIVERWYDKQLNSQIHLPGTMDEAGYGFPNTFRPKLEKPQILRLTRKNSYVGPAWYKRNLHVPEHWKNKQIILRLERVIWETRVWVNGKEVPEFQESLSTPHYFDITKLVVPGKNTLSIRVDNRKKYDISFRDMGHAYTNETQIMWNGILGDIICTAEDPIHIKNIQIYPDIQKKNDPG